MNFEIDPFDPESIQKAIDLVSKPLTITDEQWDEIGQLAAACAQEKFDTAVTDQPTKVVVTYERIENGVKITALGYDALFIEYGTGVIHPDTHRDKDPAVTPRGKYGLHWGSNPYGWSFKKLDGTVIHTLGMPANECMYRTVQEMKHDLPSLIREYFTENIK